MLAILHYILDTFWSAASLFPLSNICRTASHPPREPLPSHYAAAATPAAEREAVMLALELNGRRGRP